TTGLDFVTRLERLASKLRPRCWGGVAAEERERQVRVEGSTAARHRYTSIRGFLQGIPMIRFLRQQATRWLFVMGFAEFVLLLTAVAVAMRVRYFADPAAYAGFSQHLLARSGVFASSILLGMFALGLYQAHMRESVTGMFLRQLVGFMLGAFFLVILYYVLPQAYIGRGVFALAALFGLITVVLCRVFFFNLMDAELLKRRVLVLGAGHRAEYLVKWNRRRSDRRTFKVVGFLPVPGEAIAIT